MKKLLCIVTFLPFFGFAQVLEKDNVVVEFNIGFPNLMPIFLNSSTLFHSGPDLQQNDTRSYGQFILKGEFMMTDKFGLTLATNYSFFSTHEVVEYSTYDPSNGGYVTDEYYYDSEVHRLRIGVGFNYHLFRSQRTDGYIGGQAGGKKAWLDYRTDDPSVTQAPSDFINPLAFRFHFGLRFFFTEYLAANVEFGLGGPLVSFGATYKF